MEMLALIVVAGVAGGAVMAGLFVVANRWRPGGEPFDPFAARREGARTDVINIASVRVAGVGGLGLVVVAVTIAMAFPRIGQTIAVGALLGAAMAAVLILRRRRLGPLPSSSGKPGANTTLSIDEPAPTENPRKREDETGGTNRLRVVVINPRP